MVLSLWPKSLQEFISMSAGWPSTLRSTRTSVLGVSVLCRGVFLRKLQWLLAFGGEWQQSTWLSLIVISQDAPEQRVMMWDGPACSGWAHWTAAQKCRQLMRIPTMYWTCRRLWKWPAYWRCQHSMRSRVYVTVGRLSVRLYVPSIDSSSGMRLVCCERRRLPQISIDSWYAAHALSSICG